MFSPRRGTMSPSKLQHEVSEPRFRDAATPYVLRRTVASARRSVLRHRSVLRACVHACMASAPGWPPRCRNCRLCPPRRPDGRLGARIAAPAPGWPTRRRKHSPRRRNGRLDADMATAAPALPPRRRSGGPGAKQKRRKSLPQGRKEAAGHSLAYLAGDGDRWPAACLASGPGHCQRKDTPRFEMWI